MRLSKLKTLLVIAALLIVLVPLFAAAPAHAQTTATAAPQIAATSNGEFCSSQGFNFWVCMSGIVYWIAVGIGGYVAYICALFFDVAVRLSLNSAAYALDFTGIGWGIMRDLANMAFIFIIIYIAFTIMLKAETANTLRNLAAVIVVALLVNFSFFFTRVVIDVGNILAVQFYNNIAAGPLQQSDVTATINTAAGATKDLTAPIMNAIAPQKLLNTQNFAAVKDQGGFGTFLVFTLVFIALGVMLVFVAISFLFAGIKFLLRVVGLWFVIIASPLAFAARALPSNETANRLFKQWQSALIKFTFYPAVYLFIFYIVTLSIQALTQNSPIVQNSFGNVLAGGAGNATTVSNVIAEVAIRVALICILLFIAYILADKIIETGNQLTTRLLGRAWGAVAATAGFAGRQGFGSRFNRLAQSPVVAAGAQQTFKDGRLAGLRGGIWRGVERTSKKLASSSYDVRNAPGGGLVKKVFEQTKGTHIDTGKAVAEGFAQQAKAAKEREEKERKERAAIIRDAANKEATDRINEQVASGTPHDQKDVDRVKNFSKRDLESLKSEDIKKVAHLINEQQLKVITDSDKHTDQEKDSIKRVAEPIIKAQKIVTDELRKSAAALRTVSTAVVRADTAKGSTINAASIDAMRRDVRLQQAGVRASILAAPAGSDNTERQKDLDHLHNMEISLKDLQSQVQKIPKVGMRPDQTHIVT